MKNAIDGIPGGARAGRALDAAGAARLVDPFAAGVNGLMAGDFLAREGGSIESDPRLSKITGTKE